MRHRLSDARNTVELPRRRLATAVTERREVVAIDRGRPTGDSAGWTLSAVVLISCYPLLGSHRWGRHLKEIELRGHLKESAFVFGQLVHLPHVACRHDSLQASYRAGARFHPLTQRL
jgi:hypothetical protein